MKSIQQKDRVLFLACLLLTFSSPVAGVEVRLTGSESNCSGRVEILSRGTWGTVCDDGWDLQDADVVCRQLNCGEALNAHTRSFFGPGQGPIWLDDVACSGSERSLTDCEHRGLGNHNCEHREDAGVICSGVEVRLTGSESSCSGRVEVLSSSTWGTVCGNGWDLQDADVVCRQMNCGKALNATRGSFFGPGQGPVWLDDVACSGSERSLTECKHKRLGNHNCEHREDAGVICSGVEVRLTGSESNCSGRVEILSRGTWGTVCGNGWDLQDADVVCRQLNCGEALNARTGSFFGPGQGPIWFDNLACSGSERSLTECKHRGLGIHRCMHGEDAGVICSGVEVRLTGSKSSCSGRVEILSRGTWGAVCDDGWDLQDAEVVCRQLNCGKALNATGGSFFGPGQGPVWLDDVACSGSERSLTECKHRGLGNHDCGHGEDAGVICSVVEVRLTGSESSCSGRVEILSRGTWGTVCDDGWDLQDADVVCRQLNCGEALNARTRSFFGPGQGPIWFDDLACSGSERSLTECEHSGLGNHDCGQGEAAGVICSGDEVRLTGSESSCSGRVEVLSSSTWGTVCGNGWDLQDAEVVCRQMNCGKALNATGGSFFGPVQGPVWLDDVACSGSERSLTECKHRGLGNHNCGHGEDAGVICSGVEVRLTGSESNCSGRVEILSRGTWGTVCDDGWDLQDADVVCRQLNCGEALNARTGSFFGPGQGPIWFDNLACSGSERSLTECKHRGLGIHRCMHGEDAGVICSGVEVRLTGSKSSCSGRVEILSRGTWGTVCDDGWDMHDAEVVCRQLNCGKALNATRGSFFGPGQGPIWLDDVACSGDERSLTQCKHRGLGNNNCGHGEDAGVICSGDEVRLTGSESTCSGRVEILYRGTWGTVCDDGWDLQDAEVVCRQLNCGKALNATTGSFFGPGQGPILLSNLACSGDESSLTECEHSGLGNHDCGHGEEAGVICSVALLAPPSLLLHAVTRFLLFLIMVLVVLCVTCKTRRQAKHHVTARVEYHRNNDEEDFLNIDPEEETEKEEGEDTQEDPERLNRHEVQEKDQVQSDYDDVDHPFAEPTNQPTILTRTVEVPALFHKAEALDITPIADSCSK